MDLERRVARLEWQQKAGVAMITLLFLGAAASRRPTPSGQAEQVLQSSDFTILDRAWDKAWDQKSSTPDLIFKDQNGVARMRLGIEPDGTPIIMMRNSKEDRELAIWPDQANLYRSEEGKVKKAASLQGHTLIMEGRDSEEDTYVSAGYIQIDRELSKPGARSTYFPAGYLQMKRQDNLVHIGVTDQNKAWMWLKDKDGEKEVTTK